jgi:hypothetical protein
MRRYITTGQFEEWINPNLKSSALIALALDFASY